MPEEAHKNTKIRDYLLGNITTEEERQKIEKLLLLDDDFFEEYLLEESALVQDYVDDFLTENERQNFEQNYLVSEERLEKVKFARAFRQFVDGQEIAEIDELKQRENERGFISFFKNFFSSPLPIALGALVLLAFGIFVTWKIIYKSSDQNTLASLNKAYEKERPFEARISGLDYAPANNLRGNIKEKTNTTELNLAKSLALKSVSDNPTAENLHLLGRVYLAEKNFDEAIGQLEKAEQLAPQNAAVLSDLGVGYLEKGKRLSEGNRFNLITRSLEKIDNALQLNPNLLEARFNKAISLQELNSTEEAKKAWREYLELDPNSKWANEARQNLEFLETIKTQSKTKKDILEEFLNAFRNKDDDLAWRISNLNREMITGKLIPQQLAFEFLNAEKAEEKKKFLEALKYAGVLENQKRKDSYFSEIADFYAGTSADQQTVLKQAQQAMLDGFNLVLEDKYQESFRKFKRAQNLFTQAKDVWEAKLAEYWAASEQYNMTNLKEHRKVLEELAEFSRSKNYRWFLAEIYIWLGVNAEELTEYSKAIEYHEKAADLCVEISDIYNLEKTLTILADEYARLKQYDRSLDSLQKSLALSVEYPETSLRQKWRTFNSGARILYHLKYYAAAVAFEREALAIGDEARDITFSCDASLKLGMIYAQQQKYDEAAEYLNQSKGFAESLSEDSTIKKYLAVIYKQLGDLNRVTGDCGSALGNYEKAVENSAASNKPYEYAARKSRLLCFAAQKDEAALAREFPILLDLFEENRRQITEEASRNTFFDNEQDVYDLAINYEFGKGNYERAFNYSETSRSRSLLDLLKHGGKVSDKELEVKLPEIAKPLKLETIRPAIPDDVQIVQYSVLEDKVLIWLLTKDDFNVFNSPVSAHELNEKVSLYLEILSDRSKISSEDERNLSKQLYQILISPVKEKLDSGKEIAFVPDKFLFRLPFQSLISPETEKYLVEDFTSFFSPSANVFLISSAKAKRKTLNKKEKLLAVGNPSFDRNSFPDLPALPSAETEAEDIANIYSGAVPLTGKTADKENLMLNFPKADVVHFAGHYVIDNVSPLRSFLLLAGSGDDAALSNYELMRENAAPHTKLIILSACQTGVERYYNGEGMIGAARIFLGMGIPLVIASQWQVDSEATRILMTKFHQYRKLENLPSAVALRRAQLDMLRGGQNKDFREPFYWAAFAPIGGYTQF